MAADTGANTVNLASAAEETVVDNLGKLAESISCRFTCGGELTSTEKIQLVYENSAGELHKMVFPGASDADIIRLLDVCCVASFGVDDQLVTDMNYRNALKLDTDHFTTSFQVASTPILNTAMTLMPKVPGIQAELYKLNIYSRGGFFKAHVDTPRSVNMFGSLVVCLPTQFSGGDLVTRHHGHTVKYDWSSPPDSPRKTANWAVFFSDVEHEILPVTQGHRITLTFNLYARKSETVATHGITINPLYMELSAALGHPHFMRDGGVLGFVCHHKYVYSDLNTNSSLPLLLKGADQIVFSVAKSLGLSVIIKPVLKKRYPQRSERFLLKNFPNFEIDDSFDSEPHPITRLFNDGHLIKHITWCQPFDDTQQQAAGCIGTYGNQETIDLFYQIAAILVAVPEWGEYRKSCGSGSAQKTDHYIIMSPDNGTQTPELQASWQ